jgi:hypothetical protein
MKGRKLLMIPGPIEFEPEVMMAVGMPTTSHVAPDFIESFGRALVMMREYGWLRLAAVHHGGAELWQWIRRCKSHRTW